MLMVALLPLLLFMAKIPDFPQNLLKPEGASLLIIFFSVIILVTLASLFIAAVFTLPITELREVVKKTLSGNRKFRAVIQSKDEVGELATAFNEMLDTIQNYQDDLETEVAERTEELIEAKAKDEALLASIGDGVIAVDNHLKIMFINPAAEDLLGYNSNEVIGKEFDEVIVVEDWQEKAVARFNRPVYQAVTKGISATTSSSSSSSTDSYYYVRKNKAKLPVAFTVRPILLNGKIIGAVEAFRDITKEKEIDRAKNEFVSLASHQLRTPPTAIAWQTERLLSGKTGELTPKQREGFEEIRQSNQRMIQLVNDLLNVSRLDLDAFILKPMLTDIIALFKSALTDLNHKIEEKRLSVNEAYESEKYLIQSDENMLRIVIQNLITNAVNYTEEGGTIGITLAQKLKGQNFGGKNLTKNYLVFSITDTGWGIPEKEQEKIFTKFYRAGNTREKHTDGTGLGLYIVKSILDRFEGEIWFLSQENKGTTFYVTIPLQLAAQKTGTDQLISARL